LPVTRIEARGFEALHVFSAVGVGVVASLALDEFEVEVAGSGVAAAEEKNSPLAHLKRILQLVDGRDSALRVMLFQVCLLSWLLSARFGTAVVLTPSSEF
jgi:hypothetical protein